MKFNKDLVLKLIVAIVFVLAAYGMYGVMTYSENAKAEITEKKIVDPESDEAVAITLQHAGEASGVVVNITVGLLVLGLFIILVSTVINMINNPKGLVKSGIGVGVFLLLIVVAYFFADATEVLGANNEVLLSAEDGYTADKVASLTKWSGTGLNLTYILLSVSGLLFVGGLLKSLIKS